MAVTAFFFLSQPKRGKGRGVFSSSSSALKEKLEEKRREIILDYYLLCATRLTFNIEVDLSQKYLKGFQKKYAAGSVCCFIHSSFYSCIHQLESYCVDHCDIAMLTTDKRFLNSSNVLCICFKNENNHI